MWRECVEVGAGQWEFQVFAKSAKRAGDETWIARYILERVARITAMQLIGILSLSAPLIGWLWYAYDFSNGVMIR